MGIVPNISDFKPLTTLGLVAEECEGIKIIKVSFTGNMQPAHEQTLKSSCEKKRCTMIVQMGFSCFLKSSSSQVLWL